MLFEDQTKQAVIDSVLRLRSRLNHLELQQVADIRRLCENTNPPYLPAEMSGDLKQEYRAEWIPLGLASVIVSSIQSAMYGRVVSRKIDKMDEDETMNKILKNWGLAAPAIYNRALKYGYTVTRFFPDFRRGISWGSYDPDEATPIFDSETEDIDPVGMIYRQKVAVASVPLPHPQNVTEAIVVEHITINKRDRLTGEIIEQGKRLRWYSFDASIWHEWPYYDGDEGLNPYGDHLGAVVWRNDMSDSIFGTSDVLPAQEILQSISEVCTDLKLLLKWNIWPTQYSTAPGFQDLPYGWRQRYELTTDGSGNSPTVGTIEMNPASLETGMKYLKLLLHMMHETSSVPAIAMGDLEGLGNLTSGRALEVVMMPLKDLTLRRQKLQQYQEEQATREMLAVLAHARAEIKGKDELGVMTADVNGIKYPDTYHVDISVEFGPLGLSNSAEDAVNYYTGLYGAGLMSIEGCVAGLHPGWDEQKVLVEVDRIKASTDSREGTVVDDSRAARIKEMVEGAK